MLRRQLILLACGAALTVAAPAAHADDRAIAQQVFQEARDLLAAGKVAEACPKFAAAAQLSPTAGVRLNLSDCYAKLGKVASAWAKADEALAMSERAGDAAAANLARDRKKALEPKLSYVTVTVAEASTSGLEVTLDGEKLPAPAWGTALPADPGEHVVTASAPGRTRWTGKATLGGEASRASVQVPRLVEAPAAGVGTTGAPATTTATPAASSSGAEAESSGLGQGTIGLVTGGVGVVALGVGAAFGLSAMSTKSDYEQHQGPDGRCLDAECASLSRDALSAAKLSTIGFIAGGALVAAGAVLWLTAPPSGGEQKAVALVPGAGTSGLGASLAGSF